MFQLGDTVMLSSGGPVMTIINEPSKNNFECEWQDDDDNLVSHTFTAAMLVPV